MLLHVALRCNVVMVLYASRSACSASMPLRLAGIHVICRFGIDAPCLPPGPSRAPPRPAGPIARDLIGSNETLTAATEAPSSRVGGSAGHRWRSCGCTPSPASRSMPPAAPARPRRARPRADGVRRKAYRRDSPTPRRGAAAFPNDWAIGRNRASRWPRRPSVLRVRRWPGRCRYHATRPHKNERQLDEIHKIREKGKVGSTSAPGLAPHPRRGLPRCSVPLGPRRRMRCFAVLRCRLALRRRARRVLRVPCNTQQTTRKRRANDAHSNG